MFDLIKEKGVSSHESNEGVLNRKTNKRYPTVLRAMVEADTINDLVAYDDVTMAEQASDEPLIELYKKRLLDLRSENEYLELWWGGGYDSTMLLYVSILADTPFDNIVMFCNGNPKVEKGGMNYELHQNYRHIHHYTDAFDRGKVKSFEVHHLDIFKMWEITKKKYHDYELWCSATYGQFDDVARICADDLMREKRSGRQGTIITGKGYNGIVYNQKFNTWSYYSECVNMNLPGVISDELKVTRFFRTPEIIRSTAEQARKWFYENKPKHEGIWATTEEWDHDHHRYPELFGQIDHLGKGQDMKHPKTEVWRSDMKTRERFPEYWKFQDYLDENIPKDCINNQGSFGIEGIDNPEPNVIDF